jgi:3-hydroxyacyl-CoA dehydrogenase
MAELMVSDQARASVYAFTVVERRSKRPPNLPDASPRAVQKVGIVGAGMMATQLATLFLRRLKVPLVLRDIEQARVDEALATIRADLGDDVAVDGGTAWDHFAGCDLVLEAVFEQMEVKRDVFAEVRRVAPDATLATNTSSLSVEEMGADVGLHFFNPVAVLPLVEIVRTAHTTDEQLATAWDVVQKLRKRGVIVRDAPGFVVNRLLTRMTCALEDALANGNTVEEADEAILSLGLPMAPSVLLELVGPAVARHVLETMHAAFPDRFPLEPPTGRGRRTTDEIRDEAVAAIADEVQHLLADGVVADSADVDACLILGAGWPLFLGGVVTGYGKIHV